MELIDVIKKKELCSLQIYKYKKLGIANKQNFHQIYPTSSEIDNHFQILILLTKFPSYLSIYLSIYLFIYFNLHFGSDSQTTHVGSKDVVLHAKYKTKLGQHKNPIACSYKPSRSIFHCTWYHRHKHNKRSIVFYPKLCNVSLYCLQTSRDNVACLDLH